MRRLKNHRQGAGLLALLWSLGALPGYGAEGTEAQKPREPDAQSLDCIYRSMGRGEVFRAAQGPDPKGEFLIDLGAANAQEGTWWSERGCRANENGPYAFIDPGANITGVQTAFLTFFDKSRRRVFFQTGLCKQPTLSLDLHLFADQAILACLQSQSLESGSSRP